MKRDPNTGTLGLLGGLGVGAALMYFLDPARGTRRRNLIRDQVARTSHAAGDALAASSRDLRNRTRGAAATGRARLTREQPDDVVLVERVRSCLGRAVSHPGALHVTADEGHVTLSGQILADELDQTMARVRKVRGVREVTDQLDAHESAEHVSSLQGGTRRTGSRRELAQDDWPPGVRLLSSAAGGALALYAARRRDSIGAAIGVAGLALAARGATNLSPGRLTGVGAGRRAVDVQKTITINAPPERVFEFFAAWENWPRWMSHVREVKHTGTHGGQTRTRWSVDGPAGVPVSWDAVTTKLVLGESIGWKSVEGALVRHAGLINFGRTDDGATTVDVQMSYNPPAGAVGHAIAAFFGRDPKQQMDDDLARLKTTIETGTPPRDAANASGARDSEDAAEPSVDPQGEEERAQ